nr:agmatine deiminase family protein [Tropicibacter sp. Alg240-R139]
MANESSWVNSIRNPGPNRNQIEQRPLAAYGATRMIWGKGVKGQDVTDDHIDGFARFTGPKTGLMILDPEPEANDPFSRSAYALRDRLINVGLGVDTISTGYDGRVRDLDALSSYANYYACNGAVIASHPGNRCANATARACACPLLPRPRGDHARHGGLGGTWWRHSLRHPADACLT